MVKTRLWTWQVCSLSPISMFLFLIFVLKEKSFQPMSSGNKHTHTHTHTVSTDSMSKYFILTPLKWSTVFKEMFYLRFAPLQGRSSKHIKEQQIPPKSPQKDNNRRLRVLRRIYSNKLYVPGQISSVFPLISCFLLRQHCSLSVVERNVIIFQSCGFFMAIIFCFSLLIHRV